MHQVATQPDGNGPAGIAETEFHAGNENVRMHGRPAFEKHRAAVHAVPVVHFLRAHVRGKLRVLAQLAKAFALDPQRQSFRVGDRVGIDVQPDLIRLLVAVRAGEAIGFDRRLDG